MCAHHVHKHARIFAQEVQQLHSSVRISTSAKRLSATQVVAGSTLEAVQALDRAYQNHGRFRDGFESLCAI